MEKKCKNCKHWVNPKDEHDYMSGSEYSVPMVESDNEEGWAHLYKDEDQRKLFGYATRICINPNIKFCERPDKNGCCVSDGSGYMAALTTGEDFGCTNFEAPSEFPDTSQDS